MTRHPDPRFPTRSEQLDAIHARLTTAVEALVEGEAWQQMLRVAARLPAYSPSNVLLIAAQCPDASQVMGYRAWMKVGRQVRRGQTGIAILAPCMYREHRDEAPALDHSQAPAPPETAERILRGYRVVHVFDITQTSGPELPAPPAQLQGEAPLRLYDGLAALVQDAGFLLERGDCHGANGYTDFTSRRVRVRLDVSPAQAAKTLAHELGHIRADHEHRFLDPASRTLACRGVAEVEAESIAYLVTAVAGLDSASYSVPYIAGWGAGDIQVVRDAATWALSVATSIEEPLVPQLRAPALSRG